MDTFEAAASAAQRGDYAQATEIANRLLALNQRDANALQVLGLVYGRQGRNEEALAAFLKVDAIAPNNPPVLNSIGVLLKERGDLARARAHLERAAQLNPVFVEAHYNLASTLAAMDERALARASYENAVRANPKSAEALGRFARFLEEENDTDGARAMATRALAIAPANASAHLTLAALDASAGDHAAVIERAAAALKTTQAPQSAALLNGMMSRSLEKLERYDEAFAACAAANDIQHAYYAKLMDRQPSPRSPENVERLISYFEGDALPWTSHPKLKGPPPVFLVGFPRSGTTLLDQILSTHRDVVVMEEKENLIDAWTDFILAEGGLDRLASLTEDEVNHYRRLYFRRISRFIQADDPRRVIVDKLPLDTALLGLIHRLFPRSKIIFAVRDPRDVVLSCFQQTFAMNVAMYQFLKLDTAAHYYDRVMHLGRLCRDKLRLRVHEVRYENVVRDLRAEIEPLLHFLTINWTGEMERYYETARTRVIKTPSARQVTEKPYQSSIGKWRHYETHLREVLPVLAPWVKEFEYE